MPPLSSVVLVGTQLLDQELVEYLKQKGYEIVSVSPFAQSVVQPAAVQTFNDPDVTIGEVLLATARYHRLWMTDWQQEIMLRVLGTDICLARTLGPTGKHDFCRVYKGDFITGLDQYVLQTYLAVPKLSAYMQLVLERTIPVEEYIPDGTYEEVSQKMQWAWWPIYRGKHS